MKIFRNCKKPIELEGQNVAFLSADSDLLKSAKSNKTKLIPIIPDASQYVRDMNKYGLVGMGIRRVMKLGPKNLIKLGLFAGPKGYKVLKKDFRAMLKALLYVELLDFQEFKPKVFFLHPQITDLALANGNKELFEIFVDLVRKFDSEPGFATRNIGPLLESLEQWNLGTEYVLAPINRKGYKMKPSRKDVEQLVLFNDEMAFFADFTDPGIELDEKDITYLEKLGVKAVVQ